jgi:hypothetical protein
MEEMEWEESVKGIKNLFKPPSSIQKEEEDQATEADTGEERARGLEGDKSCGQNSIYAISLLCCCLIKLSDT